MLFPYGGSPTAESRPRARPEQAELPAGLVARRIEARVHVEPRRQRRDLRDEPRRQRRAAADQPPDDRRHADLVPDRHADRVHLGPHRHAADLHHERRRHAGCSRSPASRTAIGRPGRRRRSTRSPTPSRSGGGNIIKVFDFADAQHPRAHRRIGNNESPAFSPNGRHVAFVSSAPARNRSSRSTATARACGRSRGRERTGIRTGRNRSQVRGSNGQGAIELR